MGALEIVARPIDGQPRPATHTPPLPRTRWSAGGITANLSDTLLAFNAPSGAHHSDLSHLWPSAADTPDITAMRADVAATLERWLETA